MALILPADVQKQALDSITRFCGEELELEVSGVQAGLLLKFILADIGPSLYNMGVTDARAFLHDRLADLEATCYEPEFVYWPSPGQRRRQDKY